MKSHPLFFALGALAAMAALAVSVAFSPLAGTATFFIIGMGCAVFDVHTGKRG